MDIKFLPIPEFAPDKPDYGIYASDNIKNVLPRTLQAGAQGQPPIISYGSFPSLSPFSSALNGTCQGAYSTLDSTGNTFLFAGTSNKLHRLDISGSTFADVSKVGGYSTPADGFWRGCLFGNNVILTNFADPIQTYVLGSSSAFGDLAVAAPQARYCAPVREWLVVANTYDSSNGYMPQRVWWSAINNAASWPTPRTNAAIQVQSDYQDLVGDNGWVQGIVGSLGKSDAAIFQERAIVRMNYSGTPRIFDFVVAEGARGTPAPNSIVQVGAIAFYLGEDGYYVFDGSSSRSIGAERVDKWFFSDALHGVDQTYLRRVVGAADPINKMIFWAYPGPGNSNGNPNRILVYNWSIDKWAFAEGVECETLVRGLSFGYNLDSLDSTGFNIDTLPYSLDSRVWTAGRLILSAFDTSHKFSYFTGASLAPSVDSAELLIAPGRRMRVTNSRAIVDSTSASVAIGTRNDLASAVAFGLAVPANASGYSPQRSNGLYVKARVTLDAGQAFSHLQGVELTTGPEGIR